MTWMAAASEKMPATLLYLQILEICAQIPARRFLCVAPLYYMNDTTWQHNKYSFAVKQWSKAQLSPA